MNTERILIYRDQESLKKAEVNYSEVQRRLQILVNALKALRVVPTIQDLKNIVLNRNWTAITDQIENRLAEMEPSLAEIARKANQESLKKIQEKEAKDIQEYWNYITVSPELERYYNVQNGSVTLDQSYKPELVEQFSVYADSEGRKAALEAFYKVQAAVEEFESIVKTAPKRDLTPTEAMIKSGKILGNQVFPDDIGGLRAAGQFALAAIDPDGAVILRGENFSNLK